jgi:lipid II:glycine glycyltransferase (peptidoglycan interpeptide bridge formation enzyme)
MDRRQADSKFNYPESFFTALNAKLASNCELFIVRTDSGTVISAEVVLYSDDRFYSFLGGTDASFFPISPNDFLKDKIALHGRALGLRAFVLGGGYRPDDGIFRYKRSFAPRGVWPFFTYRVIGDHDEYRFLTERAGTLTASLGDAFFPAYRRV